MSASSDYEFGRGLLTVWLSEWCRQFLLWFILVGSLLGVQAGLLLLALTLYLRPRLDEHAPLLASAAGGSVLAQEQQMLATSGGAVVATSALGLLWTSAARVRGKTRRRQALSLGWIYLGFEAATGTLLITLALMLEVKVQGFQLRYHRALSRALWSYRTTVQMKAYVDKTQSIYQCCGTLGFSDWFVVDWYPLSLYVARYLKSVEVRNKFAEEGKAAQNTLRASFLMEKYGSSMHAKLIRKAIDQERKQQQVHEDLLAAKIRIGFSEVPFSCCNPASPLWCRQADTTLPSIGYFPPGNITIYTTGCSSRVPGFFTWYLYIATRASLCVAAFKLLVVFIARYCQSSMSNALDAGRHLSPAPGWIMPLCCKSASEENANDETQHLLSEDEDGNDEEAGQTETVDTEESGGDETGVTSEDGTTDGGNETQTDGDETGDNEDSTRSAGVESEDISTQDDTIGEEVTSTADETDLT